ncbi:MAG: SusC/RagA family TonB-linked outer membrane protein [Spirosomataceae bacterium]
MNKFLHRFVKVFTYTLTAMFFSFGMLTCSEQAKAQDRMLQGKVTAAEDNAPLPGVSVRIKGTNKGTTTDATGSFKLSVEAKSVITLSFIGYVSQEITVGNQSMLNVALVSDAKILSEVVVTALGVTKEKLTLTNSVQSVKGEELVKAREPNPVNSLVGKVAGLTVGASAELLGRPNLVLRGNTDLLFVVDGVPINSDTWNISADDIETYNVLKGATASALYGFRGKNGVVLITTKKGTKDKRGFAVELNSSTMMESGFNAIPKVQDLYGPGDHGQYAFVDGKGGGLNDGDYDIWGPKFQGQLIPQYDSPIDPATGKRTATPWVARGKDNLTRFLRPGLLANNNIAVSTSADKYDLRFSLSHNYQQGIVPNTQLNIFNFNTKMGFNFSPKLRLDANLNYNRQSTPNYPDVVYGPNSMIYNIVIWGGADWSMDDMRNYWQAGKEGVQQIYAEYQRYNNPWFTAYEWLRGHYKNDVYGQMALTYKFNNNVELLARTSVTTYDLFRNEKFPYSATVYGREEAKGDYREDKRNLFENNSEVMLKYGQKFNDLSVNAFVGGNLRNFGFNSSYASTNYLNTPGVYNFSNSLRPVQVFNFKSDMQVQSAYYSADFSYKNFLTLSTTGRLDKLSTLPQGNNTFFYPSAGLSTVVSDYLKLPEVVSFLKLRGSYANVKDGLTSATIGATPGASFPLGYGDNYASSYDGPSYRNSVGYGIQPVYNNTPGAYYSNTLNNPSLKPNSTEQMDAGLELNLFKNRLSFDVTYFVSNEGPRIFNQDLSQTTGYTGAIVNGIKTQRKGWEITLKGTPVKTQKITWDVLVNWSTYREYLKEIYGNVTQLPSNYFVGGNDSRIAINIGDRIDPVIVGAFARTPDGQLINDAGGRPIVLPRGTQQGYALPDFVWSLQNQVAYKNFSLRFQFDGRVGGVIEDYISRQTFRGGRNILTVEGALGAARENDVKGIKSYIGEGVKIVGGSPVYDAVTGQITNYGELKFAPNDIATYAQDYISRYNSTSEGNMMSKTYVKLREIVLSYNLPSALLSRTPFRQASVSLVGRNLLYFNAKDHGGVDLDQFTGLQTRSDLQTPTMKRFGVNLNLTF